MLEFDTGDLQELVAKAFRNIPQHRMILQWLLDQYCAGWSMELPPGDSDEESILPREFLLRVVRRYRELWLESKDGEIGGRKERCYLEHGNEDEKKACKKLHMRFDSEVGHGYFE